MKKTKNLDKKTKKRKKNNISSDTRLLNTKANIRTNIYIRDIEIVSKTKDLKATYVIIIS